MKTMFICSEYLLDDHEGEEYDEIVVVPHQPVYASSNGGASYGYAPQDGDIETYAKKIRQLIYDLWESDSASDDHRIIVYLDAASPFHAMLVDYQTVMYNQDGVVIQLGYGQETEHDTSDPEAKEQLNRLMAETLENKDGEV